MTDRETPDPALGLEKLSGELELLQCQVRPMAGCVGGFLRARVVVASNGRTCRRWSEARCSSGLNWARVDRGRRLRADVLDPLSRAAGSRPCAGGNCRHPFKRCHAREQGGK